MKAEFARMARKAARSFGSTLEDSSVRREELKLAGAVREKGGTDDDAKSAIKIFDKRLLEAATASRAIRRPNSIPLSVPKHGHGRATQSGGNHGKA